MLIRSKIERQHTAPTTGAVSYGTVVPFGHKGSDNYREYHFRPAPGGKVKGHVCEVPDELDAATFLAIEEGYEPADAASQSLKSNALPIPAPAQARDALSFLTRKGLTDFASRLNPPVKLDESHSDEQVRNYLRGLTAKRG